MRACASNDRDIRFSASENLKKLIKVLLKHTVKNKNMVHIFMSLFRSHIIAAYIHERHMSILHVYVYVQESDFSPLFYKCLLTTCFSTVLRVVSRCV